MKFDVFGIGNPMLDAIIKVDESYVNNLNLNKGSMRLVDEKTSEEIFDSFKNHKVTFSPGGDVVNTVVGITNLGGKAAFCGKVGLDEKGILIEENLKDEGVEPVLIKGDKGTGLVICLVTPDNERTMLTHLGCAITLNEDEVIIDEIKNSKLLYLTGYVLEDLNLRAMALKALKEAKKHGKKIAIDVSDSTLVERCKNDLKKIIIEYADILFANEDEAFALTGKKREEALNIMSEWVDLAIVKIGKDGSLINDHGTIHLIRGFKVDAVDTTGAGDMFAAGFLFGLTNGYKVEQAGLIGNFAASKVVQELGARLKVSLKNEIRKLF